MAQRLMWILWPGFVMAIPAVGIAFTLVDPADLHAFGVRFGPEDIIAELEKGRPVMIPVRLPSIYVQTHTFFDPDPVVIGDEEVECVHGSPPTRGPVRPVTPLRDGWDDASGPPPGTDHPR